MMPAISASAPAIGRLMVVTSAIAATVATQGGSTFQMNMFSAVNTAFEVAVTRLVSMPGSRSAKIARRMSHQVAKQIAPQIAGDADEGGIGDPARDPPQKIIGGNQGTEQAERDPDASAILLGQSVTLRERVDQEFDAILRADRADHRAQHRGEDHRVRERPKPDVAKDEGEGTRGVTTKIGHSRIHLRW